MKKQYKVKFKLNGKIIEETVYPFTTLAELLRQNGLTAVKIGCAKGECGACTVLLNDRPINSCLKLAVSLQESDEIKTVEYLKNTKLMQNIHTSFVEKGAVQCGFCIPGITVSAYSALKQKGSLTKDEARKCIEGNICRCTGYEKIFEAISEVKGDKK